jgi:hypothetical protein
VAQGRICICMYVYLFRCMYVYWSIYVGSCIICIPTGCICSLHIYIYICNYMYICVQFTRVSCMRMCTRMRVYTCFMYMLRV